ncbi:hypothetical protein [Rhodococcus koreensis]|jgi:hypothetical protein|uniref:hypothetical protein n=1 Tax=Rhodococcus koreensis TaxID=99653 RepID=UPI0030845A1B
MVAFEVRWCAHGGGPAETIMADFGMDAAAFFRQLTEYLENSPPTPLRPDVVERMKGRYAAAPLAGHLTGPETGSDMSNDPNHGEPSCVPFRPRGDCGDDRAPILGNRGLASAVTDLGLPDPGRPR